MKTNNQKFNLDFHQAIDVVMNGGVVKGNDFRKGIYLKLNSWGQLVTVDANDFYREDTTVFIKGLKDQMFYDAVVLNPNVE